MSAIELAVAEKSASNKPKFMDVKTAPAPIGHYRHAVVLPTGQVHLSGQKAWRQEDGVLIDGDVRAQTRLALSNIQNILQGLGLDYGDLTRLICHLANPGDYEAFNATYAEVLGTAMPTRAVLAGSELRGGALVEIVADAFSRGTLGSNGVPLKRQ